MGYVVKPLKDNKFRSWKLQHQSYHDGVRKIVDIPAGSLPGIGFSEAMWIEQAIAKKDQINAQAHLKRLEESRVKIITRLQDESLVQDAYPPASIIQEFEEKQLFQRMDKVTARRNRISSHWRAVKRMLCDLRIAPSEWAESTGRFSDYFAANECSLSYAQKFISMMNRGGPFRLGARSDT